MGTHPIFESDFDCLTESDCSQMFRLSKGNQSRKNHKIINQTTKVSDADAKLSTPAMQAQQHQEALMKQQAEEEAAMLESQKKLVEQTIVNPTQSEPENKNNETDKITIQIINAELKQTSDPLQDMESYVNKMGEYMLYMKELEERNARLEFENSRYRAENESLKGQLSSHPSRIQTTDTAGFNQSPNPSIFPIQEKIRNLQMQKH